MKLAYVYLRYIYRRNLYLGSFTCDHIACAKSKVCSSDKCICVVCGDSDRICKSYISKITRGSGCCFTCDNFENCKTKCSVIQSCSFFPEDKSVPI